MSTWTPGHKEQVLSTLNADGTRHWLRPRVSAGRFHAARRVLGYLLILIFVSIPHLRIGGKPVILLDIATRQFTFFGYTFLPTDTLLLAFFLVGLVVTIFLVTALLGRIWCGWFCPQLVYLEFVFRPLEYFLDGAPGSGGARGKSASPLRTAVKYAVFFVIAAFLAHTFLAYFVSADRLLAWMRGSPFAHPVAFAAVIITTGLMMFDFSYFREQTCILACPYGRLQSVMVDRDSLIISYDPQRGEPRGKPVRDAGADAPKRGDCVDCFRCVETCPTGIDIRNGLQLECVGCAQCIDACDAAMDKLKRPRGLIRYSSQARIARENSRILRPRVIIYPAILLALIGGFSLTLASKQPTEVRVLRDRGLPFILTPEGNVRNQLRLRITNRSGAAAEYTVRIVEPPGLTLHGLDHPIAVAAGKSELTAFAADAPRSLLHEGELRVVFEVTDGAKFTGTAEYEFLGPRGPAPAAPATAPAAPPTEPHDG